MKRSKIAGHLQWPSHTGRSKLHSHGRPPAPPVIALNAYVPAPFHQGSILTETYCSAKRQQRHRCRKSGRGPRPARHCKTTATRIRITASRSGKTIEYASTAALNVLGRFLKPKLCPPACWLALSWRGVAAPHVVLLRLPGSPQDVPDSSGRAF